MLISKCALQRNTYQQVKDSNPNINISIMRQIYSTLFLVALLLSAADCRRNKQKLAEQTETKEERQTVVEANHYFSDYEKTAGYDIDSVESGKSLVFFLKNKEGKASDDKVLIDNPITITLDADKDTATCVFDSYSKLCSLSKVEVEKMKLKIECKKTPCELSWEIIQPAVQETDGDHKLQELVAVNAVNSHAALNVHCNNPELQEIFADSIKLYTNSKYKKVSSKLGSVYFLFDNEEKGYYYLTTDNEKVKACANTSLNHADEVIAFGDEKQSHFDFIGPGIHNIYEFKTIPTSDFRVEFSAHDIAMEKLLNTTGVRLILNGYKGGVKKVIDTLSLFVDDEKEYIEFTALYKKPAESYDKMQLQLHGVGSNLIIQSRYIASDTQEIEMGEEAYFTLTKGEKFKIHLTPLVMVDESVIKKMYIFVDDSKKFKSTETSCEIKGCTFEVEAIESGVGSVYIGEGETKDTKETIVYPFEKHTVATLRQGDERVYSTKIKKGHAIQILINTPNAIAYAASKTKCPTIDEKDCYEKIINYHNPTVYEPTQDDTLLIKVIALDNAQMALNIIESNSEFVELTDTVPFAYLFDNEESKMVFSFTLPTKQDVTFNLVGPTNQLDLLVINKQKSSKEDEENANWANDGFIKFQSKDIKETKFYIQVRKRAAYASKWIHFTLIASSKTTVLQLEPGVAHYENLKPKDSKDYVFEFVPDKRLLLNFYTHNIKSDVKLHLKVSNAREYNSTDNTAEFTIDKEVDVLDMALVSKKLCSEQSENCEIFMQLENQMSIEADITVTLLVEDSIIQLKDGVWQNYNINSISSTSHFYFIPNHQDHSTTIFYKSTLVDLKIMYSLWKSDSKSMNPSTWPFPLEFKENQKLSELTFKPLHFIHIESAQMKQCWPICLVLLSIVRDQGKQASNLTKFVQLSEDNDFKIMASNNFIELPEKHKVDIPLVKNQTKQILVDLKYHLDKEEITFYTYITLGSPILKVNVYTEKNPRCPTIEEDADFKFIGLETGITVEDIKAKISENSMEGDSTPYLCVLAVAPSDSKFSIEWTSDKNTIKTLAIDTTTALSTISGQKTIYQIDTTQETYLKITRDEGFPYFSTKTCKPEGGDFSNCVSQFEQSDEKGIQLADKVTTLENPVCVKCALFIKFSTPEPCKMDIHVQSKYTEVELAENKALSDALQINEENRYTLTGTKNEEIIINIQIISGNIKVGVHDFQKVDIQKSNAPNSKNIHIVIPPKDLSQTQKALGTSSMTAFSLSSFIHLHLTVSSTNPKEKAVYTITYSSGEAIAYLQDGLIAQYNLVAKKPTKFMYINPTTSQIYLHITAPDASSLNKLEVKMFALDNAEDEDGAVSMAPQKPDFKKKTPNPTMLMLLPAKKSYYFQITNKNDKDTLFTIGINNREIIYLPFDHEFPLHLGMGDYLYVVLYNTAPGYIKISLNKCDQSQPFVAYTLDYNEFVGEDFQVEEQMTDELSQDLIIKVKQPGGVYMKLRSPQDDTTLMSVKATFSPNKIQASKSKPGDKGLIQYQLLDSTKAELTFTTLVCSQKDKNCNKDFAYSSISSGKIEDIYAQLVCPTIMFDLPDAQQLKSAQVNSINGNNIKNNKVTFTQEIKGEIEYVGVKAINSKTGETVYYQPVQIVTFWGQVHRTSSTNLILGLVLICIFACGGMVIYRRYRKSQDYTNLADVNDEIDHY